MQLGASFSHRHLKELGFDPRKVIGEFARLGLEWVRLGCYWDEVEPKREEWSLEEVEWLVGFCQKKGVKVVLTVGMKAPRWPEYYIPGWAGETLSLGELAEIDRRNKKLLELALTYLGKVARHFGDDGAVEVWQVENEPLDPSGSNWWRIGADFLEAEVDLVRRVVPSGRIMVNLWGNELTKRKVYRKAMELGDIVGFDLYLRHPAPVSSRLIKYIGPLDSKERIGGVVGEIKEAKKSFWVTELQAEPWEPGEIVTEKKNPPSFLPKHLESNLDYVVYFEPEVVLLWGFEFWYRRKQMGDDRYWDEVERVIGKYRGR